MVTENILGVFSFSISCFELIPLEDNNHTKMQKLNKWKELLQIGSLKVTVGGKGNAAGFWLFLKVQYGGLDH